MGKIKNYELELDLSKIDIIKRIGYIENYNIRFEKVLNDKTSVVFVTKSFHNLLVAGFITMMIIIEEKDENKSEVTITFHNSIPYEGLLNDFNIGKKTRKHFFEEFEKNIISQKEIEA